MRENLATLVADFRRYRSRIAVVTHRGNRSFPCTWSDLAILAARFAHELDRRDLRPGDRLLIWGDNSAEWVAAFFGCVLRGVVAVPLDVAGGVEFAHRVVEEVQPRLLVGNRKLLASLALEPSIAALPFDLFREALPSPDDRPIAGLSRDTTLQIVFTSGTTAEPKGIVHTHGNVLASLDPLEAEIQKYMRYVRIVQPLRFLNTLPLSHVFGQFMGLWVPPLIGTEVHYEARLQAPRLIRTVHEDRISVMAAVPRVLEMLRSHFLAEMPELPAELSAAAGQPVWKRWWRFAKVHRSLGFKFWAFVSGGATVLPELESFWATLGFALVQGYGMTETTALVTLNHPFKIARGSLGKPLAGREVRLAPDGEIQVRGASVADQVWRHGRIEERGEDWLETGDLAARNAAGNLVFAGRKKDVIVTSSGLKIYPQDLEAALLKQPGIRAATVVAYASETGSVAAAALIPQPGNQAPSNESTIAAGAVASANRELAGFQQMLYWKIWPQLDFPRTSTGKVRRGEVQNWMQQTLSTGQTQAVGLTDPLIEVLHRLQPSSQTHEIHDDDRLAEELHLDSLSMVQLQSALETQFGVELEDADWQMVHTVGDLRNLLHRPESSSRTTAEPSFPERAPESEQNSGAALSRRPEAAAGLPPKKLVAKRRARLSFPRWPWWPIVRMVRIAFLEVVARPLVRMLLAPEIEPGTDSSRRLQRPSLLIANHVTTFDLPILLSALPAGDRHRVAVAMSGELLGGWRRGKAERHGWLSLLTPLAYGLVTALFNVFPLPRGSGLRRSFAHAGRALDRGDHVLVFPEGGRSADGRLQDFEPGIGLLAEESQVPVQPFYIEGLGPLKLAQKSWFRPGIVRVRRGEALHLEPDEDPAHFARRLHDAVQALAQRPSSPA